MADLSLMRNATRDWAESMRRFDECFRRMQRVGRRMLDDGATSAEIRDAMNEALRGHPDLQVRVRDFTFKLETRRDAERARAKAPDA